MPSRTAPPAVLLFAYRPLAAILAWSLLFPAAVPGCRAPVAVPQPPLSLVPAAPHSIAGVPVATPNDPVPQSDAKTSRCAPLPEKPDDFVPPDLGQPQHPNKPGDEWGEITVAPPKIWQFDRVSSLLDGLLRDVEGVSLSDLIQLNPNAQNAAAIKFVQSALEVGVQYDQAAAVNAQNTLSTFQAQQGSQLQQLNAYNAYLQTLTTQRNNLASQLAAATNQVNILQALQSAGTATPAQAAELLAAQASVQSLTSSLTATNSLISGAGAAPTLTTPPTLVGTSVTGPASGSTMSSSLNGFSQVLSSLPQGVQNNLSSALGSPTLPATKQLDNFITLLYERLAREVSVLQDDLMRDPENEAFLLQFDVGLYPSKRASDHVARVEFNLQCPGCRIYSLYPGMSAYNIASYTGSSKRTTLWGNVLTLFGFGLSASYRRQVDTLQGGLIQSVYTAGFQNGVLNTDSDYSQKETAGFATQSFGWYYGQAPTEKLVTPGIRTTFAMLTVPRDLITKTKDGFGNLNACLAFDINGAWARRDNPTLQHSYLSALGDAAKVASFPAYYPNHHPLYNHDDEKSYVFKRASVKLPAPLDDVPLVARRERQKLHVIGVEYNTVYAPLPPPSSGPPPTSTSVSTSSTTSTTPAVTPNTTTTTNSGSTTTTTTTTSTGTPTTPTKAPPPVTPTTYANLNPLPCPEYECSAMLLRLDRPIDPNLVVTVNGLALQRIRDWRGRATSILPAAQSGSDLSAQAAAAGTTFSKQLQDGRSLLESDKMEANAWYPLNSRDLLLNVSKSVATQEEFPIIQIAEPGGTVTIPYDLQTSTTELFINHFHIKPQTNSSITETILRNYAFDTSPPPSSSSSSAPLWSGPYAPSTFVPLFGSQPAPKKFYVQVGLTGEDLLIGLLPDSPVPQVSCGPGPTKNSHCPARFNLSEAHTQVILEDSQLDFAWSLPCYVQDEQLACHFPRHEIFQAYRSYLLACGVDPLGVCPALDEKYLALKQGFTSVASSSQAQASSVPAAHSRWESILPRAFVTSTQLWVEQFDPEGQLSFYSAEPTKIDFLPLSDAFWQPRPKTQQAISFNFPLPTLGPDNKITVTQHTVSLGPSTLAPPETALFNPWHFRSANSEEVEVEGCNYTPDLKLAYDPSQRSGPGEASPLSGQTQAVVKLLGSGLPNIFQWLDPPAKGAHSDDEDRQEADTNCGTFNVKTVLLAKDGIVFVLRLPPTAHSSAEAAKSANDKTKAEAHGNTPDVAKDTTGSQRSDDEKNVDVVMHLATARLKPSFGTPRVIPGFLPSVSTTATNVGCAPDQHASENTSGNVDKSQSARVGPAATQKVLKLACWDIYLPATRLASGDKFEIPGNLSAAGFDYFWGASTQANQPVPAPLPEEMSLHLRIKRSALPYLPANLELLRYWGKAPGVPVPVANLPNLRRLLLPSSLKLITVNDHQFALQGENAGLIDAVTVSTGDSSTTVPAAASGNGFVIATLPGSSTKPADQNSNSSSTAGTQNSSNITVVDTSASSKITINKQNKSTPAAKPQTPPVTPPDKNSAPKDSPGPLAAGSYAVTPLILVGYTVDSKKVADSDSAANESKAAANALAATKAAVAKAETAKAKPEDIAKAKAAQSKAQTAADAAKAKAEQAAKDASPVLDYMPLDVTDDKGGPLIFVVPEAKKPAADPKTSPTPTCTAPCAVPMCAVAGCLPAPKPAATPSS